MTNTFESPIDYVRCFPAMPGDIVFRIYCGTYLAEETVVSIVITEREAYFIDQLDEKVSFDEVGKTVFVDEHDARTAFDAINANKRKIKETKRQRVLRQRKRDKERKIREEYEKHHKPRKKLSPQSPKP